ncbi:MAG: T9SS type A sorting domain-containing protein, partial [Bacteroidetes bacterium]|nr:T9SS type A sorting domain-containing protein [Bacteroidota bacterium]
ASGINGNLTVTTKNLNAATNYFFTGTSDQVTGALITNAKNITLANTSGKVSLSNSIAITGTLSIPTGNKLDVASYILSGVGDIDLQSGGTFLTAHTSGLNGNNTTSGGLSSYSTTANYTFNNSSSSSQVTGSFMPSTVNNLTVSNSAGVSLIAGTTVSGTLSLSSGKLSIGANTLTLAGTFSGSASNSLTGSSSSNVSISGTPGTVYFDQTSLGTSNLLKNLTLSGSGTTTLGNTLNIVGGSSFGVVTVGGTATLASAGNLILKSTSAGTAAIGNSSGTITGNITVERFISGSGRKWRYLSSPVTGQTLANWGSQFYITGPGTPGATVGSQNSNGYATTRSNLLGFNNIAGTPASVRTYNRTTSGTMENAWANPTTDMSTTLTPGVGYRAFVRGPITGVYATDTVVIGYYNTSGAAPSQAALTLSQTGGVSNGVNAGSVVITINSTGTGTASAFDATNDGWNLIGNPYPCAFDWGAFWTANANRTNIVNSIYIYDVTASSYKSYNGSALSGSLNNGLIPSSTSFFIQASASGAALTFTEAFKSTSAPSALHKNSLSDELHITYYKDSTESDEYILKMMEGATLENDMYDIKKLKNVNLNLSSYGTDSINLTLSSIPFVTDETRISLNVEATQIGTYKFDFNTIETFDNNKSVSLLDKFTGETIDIRKNPVYTFEMDAAPHQWGNDRFVLIFKAISTSGMVDMNANSILNTKVSVYPNPATDVLNVNINNASFKNSSVSILNISGTELLSSNMVGTSSQFNIESLSSGVYFVKIRNSNGFDKTVKFIK